MNSSNERNPVIQYQKLLAYFLFWPCWSEVVKCDLCGYEVCRCAGPEEGAGEG